MVQVDGQTDKTGINLYEFAGILLDLGIVNAVNLDGGGSVTTVINGTLVNYPSDKCADKIFNCEREVSTILCVHDLECDPEDCSDHGVCKQGLCQCHQFWSGPKCDILTCPHNCSNQGVCTSDGCVCDSGWWGHNCSEICPDGQWGPDCSQSCGCHHGSTCDHVTGQCLCPLGYTGRYCESECPHGFYGDHCHQRCNCSQTGNCLTEQTADSATVKVGQCIAAQMIVDQKLVPDQSDQLSLNLVIVIILGTIAVISLTANGVLLWLYSRGRRGRLYQTGRTVKKRTQKFVFHSSLDTASESDDFEDDVTIFQQGQKRFGAS